MNQEDPVPITIGVFSKLFKIFFVVRKVYYPNLVILRASLCTVI